MLNKGEPIFLVTIKLLSGLKYGCVEWVRAVCARLGSKVVAVEGLTDVLAEKRKIN